MASQKKASTKKSAKKGKSELPAVQQVAATEHPFMQKLEQLTKEMASMRSFVDELKQKLQPPEPQESRHQQPVRQWTAHGGSANPRPPSSSHAVGRGLRRGGMASGYGPSRGPVQTGVVDGYGPGPNAYVGGGRQSTVRATRDGLMPPVFNGYCRNCSGYGHKAAACPLNWAYPTL